MKEIPVQVNWKR